MKRGVHPEDHAVIYTSTTRTSTRTSEQRSLLTKHTHKATLASTNKLDPISRLNYAKLYTVEHDVKVWFIGKVDGKSINHDPDLNHGMYMNEGELTRSNRESGSTSKFLANGVPTIAHRQIFNCPLMNKLDLRLYKIEAVKTSDWPENQVAEKATEVLDGWKLVEEHGELFLILEDETCDCDKRKYSHFQRLTRVMTSPKALAGSGMVSGLLMGASFLWLNKRMELNHTSPIMGWVRTSHLLRNQNGLLTEIDHGNNGEKLPCRCKPRTQFDSRWCDIRRLWLRNGDSHRYYLRMDDKQDPKAWSQSLWLGRCCDTVRFLDVYRYHH
jgi:hypothetical protein